MRPVCTKGATKTDVTKVGVNSVRAGMPGEIGPVQHLKRVLQQVMRFRPCASDCLHSCNQLAVHPPGSAGAGPAVSACLSAPRLKNLPPHMIPSTDWSSACAQTRSGLRLLAFISVHVTCLSWNCTLMWDSLLGLAQVKDMPVKQNLMGRSRVMRNKDWVDAQGRKGKVRGWSRLQNRFCAGSMHVMHTCRLGMERAESSPLYASAHR